MTRARINREIFELTALINIFRLIDGVSLIGFETGSRHRVLGTVVAESCLRQRFLDDVDGVFENRKVIGWIVGIGLGVKVQTLETVVAATNSNFQAPVTQLIEQRQILGQTQRVPEGDDGRGQADTYLPGTGCNIGCHHQRIRQHFAAPDAEVVLGQPEVVEARVFTERGQLSDLVEHVPVVTFVINVPRVREVANLHWTRVFDLE